jgi:predicted Fe-Mo cluster-binding NifX family protein
MKAIRQTVVEKSMMKIAIPMANGSFSEHFGGAKAFLVYHGNCMTRNLDRRELFGAPEHKPGSLPQWLEAQKVDALVSSAIGERALIMLANAGIMVFLADDNSDPSALALSCLTGKLQRANGENSRCGGHHHEHGDGHACHQH